MFRKPVDKATHLIAMDMLHELKKRVKTKTNLMKLLGVRPTQFYRWEFGEVRISEETYLRIKELYQRKETLCPTTQK